LKVTDVEHHELYLSFKLDQCINTNRRNVTMEFNANLKKTFQLDRGGQFY